MHKITVIISFLFFHARQMFVAEFCFLHLVASCRSRKYW